jgi:rod shape-determining protein MreD
MANYIGIPLLMIAALLNTTVMPEFRLGGGAPDLVFMLVASWALLADIRQALVWALIGGIFQDWLSIAPLGASSLGLVIVVFLADSIFGQISRNNIFVPPLVAAVGTVICHLGMLMALRMAGTTVPAGQGLFYVTLPTVIYNTILIVPVFRLVGLIQRWLQPRRVRLE